jgi:hypothetical protein
MGVAAYHPESARLARVAARGSHVGMSLFSMGGNVGFILSPVIVGIVLGALGATGNAPPPGPVRHPRPADSGGFCLRRAGDRGGESLNQTRESGSSAG